jgi:hypothetical protein
MKNYSYIIFGLFKVIIPVWIGAGNQKRMTSKPQLIELIVRRAEMGMTQSANGALRVAFSKRFVTTGGWLRPDVPFFAFL